MWSRLGFDKSFFAFILLLGCKDILYFFKTYFKNTANWTQTKQISFCCTSVLQRVQDTSYHQRLTTYWFDKNRFILFNKFLILYFQQEKDVFIIPCNNLLQWSLIKICNHKYNLHHLSINKLSTYSNLKSTFLRTQRKPKIFKTAMDFVWALKSIVN